MVLFYITSYYIHLHLVNTRFKKMENCVFGYRSYRKIHRICVPEGPRKSFGTNPGGVVPGAQLAKFALKSRPGRRIVGRYMEPPADPRVAASRWLGFVGRCTCPLLYYMSKIKNTQNLLYTSFIII